MSMFESEPAVEPEEDWEAELGLLAASVAGTLVLRLAATLARRAAHERCGVVAVPHVATPPGHAGLPGGAL